MMESEFANSKNPWEEIDLDTYEKHMRLDTVRQLQAMNAIMKQQFEAYPVQTAMVLGVAGGNGLEHIRAEKYKTVYGVDINANYLRAVSDRFDNLKDILQCLQIDLISETEKLPNAQLVIANLLIEYIGYDTFQKAIMQIKPEYVSCVIQINTDQKGWVSDSPYLHTFDSLDRIHHQMDETSLIQVMKGIGYSRILQASEPLPNGKALVSLDFARKM